MSRNKKSLLRGTQIFSSRGISDLPRELIQKLYFSSNSQDSFKSLEARVHASGNGCQVHEFAGQSFAPMFGDKLSKEYKGSQSPNFTRESCTHFHDYKTKPLEGRIINMEASKLFKSKSNTGNISTDNGKFTGKSVMKSEYPTFSTEEVMTARPGNFKPVRRMSKSDAKSLVTCSTSRAQYINFDRDIARLLKGESFSPKCYRRVNKNEIIAKSIYKSDFCDEEEEQKIRAARSPRREDVLTIENPCVSMADMMVDC